MTDEKTLLALKEKLPDYVDQITEPSKSGLYNCPLCGSGTGPNGTGAFSIYEGTHWKCFACDKGGDVFDLIGELEDIPDFPSRLKRAGEIFNVDVTVNGSSKPKEYPMASRTIADEPVDYTGYFKLCNDVMNEFSIFRDGYRGISLPTLNRFQCGLDKHWIHPKRPQDQETWRLIIPNSNSSYLARDIRSSENVPDNEKHFTKAKVGKQSLFNSQVLFHATEPIFIVEGELDALSVIDVGGEAMALGSVSMKKHLFKLLEKRKPVQPLIICMDNDEAGYEAGMAILNRLTEMGIDAFLFNLVGQYKDANEYLQADRSALEQAVRDGKMLPEKVLNEMAETYKQHSAAGYIPGFIESIANGSSMSVIPTGFAALDSTLDGGLYEGLYVVGAISSLGKTTFTIQIADQIAKNGQDVLIFSLEMSRYEIMSKSISRHTMTTCLQQGLDISLAKSARGITAGKRYSGYSDSEKELIRNALSEYEQYSRFIYIQEGIGDIGVNQIRNAVANHKKQTGTVPVVIVDYLQILAPHNDYGTDKQNTDKAILELKRISRDFKTPVIAISSFNRMSYSAGVSMEAFKESGAIEYSSDVLIGLQLKGAGEKDFDVTREKSRTPRRVEAVILKNRNGEVGLNISFEYYPKYNLFVEMTHCDGVKSRR